MKFVDITLKNKEDVMNFLKKEDLINQFYELESTNLLFWKKKEEFIKNLKEQLYLELLNPKTMGVYFNLLYENKELIGFSTSNKELEDRAYLGRIVIKKEYQKKGYGLKLLINTVAKLRVRGFTAIDLTAKSGLHKVLKKLTAQAKIDSKRRQFNSDFKYSMNNRKLDPNKNEPITIEIKKQKRKKPVFLSRAK